MHLRQTPVRYQFFYRVFYLLLDIDRLAQSSTRLFSHNRWNLLSFYDRDHGPRDGSPLRPWLERLLGRQGIDLAGGRIRLLCLPRILGFGFNPISIYYCQHRDGSLRAILCEVRNTFGESHCYLLDRKGQAMHYTEALHKAKAFHVSPLISMDGEYRFRFSVPAERFRVLIRLFQPDCGQRRLLMSASLQGERQSLNDRNLLRQLLAMPLMTLKVVTAIHWQALKIWLRGASFHRKPAPPTQEVS
jgi:uncharacterized protein